MEHLHEEIRGADKGSAVPEVVPSDAVLREWVAAWTRFITEQ